MTSWYQYNTVTYDSRWRIRRFSHRARIRHALRLLDLTPVDALLDYGGADGYLVRTAISHGLGGRYAVYDPFSLDQACERLAGFKEVEFYNDTAVLPDCSFSKIACLEVLEHVAVEVVSNVIADIYRLLHEGGTLVLSVPIEIGPASLMKNAVRLASGTTFPNTTPRTAILSLLGMTSSIPRRDNHIGFDYRAIAPLLVEAGFQLKAQEFSPFGLGRALVNSQVHYCAERPIRDER